MGYAKRSAASRVLYASALVAAASLALLLIQLHAVAVPEQVATANDKGGEKASGRRLTPKELGYRDEILDSDLLQPGTFFAEEALASGLDFQIMAQGFNHKSALVLNLHNSNQNGESIQVDLPAGMLFAPAQNRELQNLVLRDAVTVNLQPGESTRIEQWAYCGNLYHVPPITEMKASGWILQAPRCQHCVWKATAPYELPVASTEGPWMVSKLASAIDVA